MTDAMVLQTQQWLNMTYKANAQWRLVTEDGFTGWGTMFGLIRGLQIELGIPTLADNFGAGTLSAFSSKFGSVSESTKNKNVIHLAQGALWCKGYAGGYQGGVFDSTMKQSVINVTTDMGIGAVTSIDGKVLKSLMSMDAYTTIAGGTASQREVQQWLNGKYSGRRDFSILPCDGIFSRNTQQGMMYAIQYELGMADGAANGNFGPGTKSGLQSKATVTIGSSDTTSNWVRLYQGALRFNGYNTGFDGAFTTATRNATTAFQSFAALTVSGNGDYHTWASLLISTGDDTRAGVASDMATQLTADHCALLYDKGYRTVGRYLTVDTKRYVAGELDRIFDAGLATFPIMQEANTSTADFNYDKGRDHGKQALIRLRQLGFTGGTTVFFAVDFDALGDQITMYVEPYFQGVRDVLNSTRETYKIGVYGTRNVCTRIINAGLAGEAFLSDMSWGFSGNLGFPLSPSWSYDQIAGQSLIGTTGTSLPIDKDIQSGQAKPARRADVLPTPVVYASPSSTTPSGYDEDYYWYLTELTVLAEMAENNKTGPIADDFVLHYLQRPTYWTMLWQNYEPLPEVASAAAGGDEIAIARLQFEQSAYRAPQYLLHRLEHWAASCRAYRIYSGLWPAEGSTSTMGDLGGWALDLVQAWSTCYNASTSNIRQWIAQFVGAVGENEFSYEQVVADVDGYLVARMLRIDPGRPLSDCIREIEYSSQNTATWRFAQFVNHRFGGDRSKMVTAATDVFTSEEWWTKYPMKSFLDGAPRPTADDAREIGNGFADAIDRLAGR